MRADAARFRPVRRTGLLQHAFRLLLLACLVTAVWLAISSGLAGKLLAPSSVQVRGADMTPAQEVLRVLDCSGSTTLPGLWLRCRQLDTSHSRWLLGVSMLPRLSRGAVLEVRERRPLLRVADGRLKAWLCDDSMLVPVDPAADSGSRFSRLTSLPEIRLPAGFMLESAGSPGCIELQELVQGDELLAVAAACASHLPGQVAAVEYNEQRQVVLHLKDGFEVRLGEMRAMDVKLAALPKALRLCEDQRDKLLYLDASDSGIFYQKWKGDPPAES